MNWATGLMVYFVIWWTILFTVLPLGVRRVQNPEAGHDHGAPQNPQLLRKAIITSLVAAVLWLAFFAIHQSDLFDLRKWGYSL